MCCLGKSPPRVPFLLLLLLPLFSFSQALTTVGPVKQLTYEAQKPYLEGLTTNDQKWVYSSMCIGSKPDLVRRCLISAARWRYVVKEKDIPLIYYVNDFPEEAGAFLKSLHNVYVVPLGEMEWIKSSAFPKPPVRFYSFYKLAAFHLYGYKILWFDSDAYLFQSPTFLFDLLPDNATETQAVAWQAKASGHASDYFNSGIMVFKANEKVMDEIYDVWGSGDFHKFKVKPSQVRYRLTEQEALLMVFGKDDRLIPLPNCVNFRDQPKYHGLNRRCNISQVVAFHDWQAFTMDLRMWCFYWKKAMMMGPDGLLCEADKLAGAAPPFSLESCSMYFNPPSEIHLCNSSVPDIPWTDNIFASAHDKKMKHEKHHSHKHHHHDKDLAKRDGKEENHNPFSHLEEERAIRDGVDKGVFERERKEQEEVGYE